MSGTTPSTREPTARPSRRRCSTCPRSPYPSNPCRATQHRRPDRSADRRLRPLCHLRGCHRACHARPSGTAPHRDQRQRTRRPARGFKVARLGKRLYQRNSLDPLGQHGPSTYYLVYGGPKDSPHPTRPLKGRTSRPSATATPVSPPSATSMIQIAYATTANGSASSSRSRVIPAPVDGTAYPPCPSPSMYVDDVPTRRTLAVATVGPMPR